MMRLILNLALLTIPLELGAAPPEHFYVSLSINASQPEPSVSANRIDTHAKWFDDRPHAELPFEAEFALLLPSDYLLATRYQEITGTHFGEAARRQCFLNFCSWIGSSIVTALPKTDHFSYRLRSAQIWLEKAPIEAFPLLHLRGGLNLIEANMHLSGGGVEQSEHGVLPIPFFGFAIHHNLTEHLSVEADANYSRFAFKKGGVKFLDTSLALSRKINKQWKMSFGAKKYLLDAWYQQENIDVTLSIAQKTPFIKLIMSY